jgi:hypothetical protein
VSDVPISENAMEGLPEHLIDRDWCADPANFKTRPYIGTEKGRIDAIACKEIAAVNMSEDKTITINKVETNRNYDEPQI